MRMAVKGSDPRAGLNAAVAAVLNGERTAAQMTLENLSAQSGISYRTLQRLLQSRDRDIDLAVLEILAATFRLTPAQVITAAQERMARMLDAEELEARAAMRAELERQNPRSRRKTSEPVRKAKKSPPGA